MQRKLNVKLLAIVFASFMLAGIGVHFLHGYQVMENAYRLLQLGDKAVLEKDRDKALSYYGQYLTLVPNDADTTQKYAEVLDVRANSDGERVSLVLKMEQVLHTKPSEHALRLRLVHNLIALDRIPEAIGHLRKLKDNASANAAEIRHMLGWCQDAQRQYPEAVRSFTEAIGLDKKQIRSYALLAEVLHERLNQPDEAQKVMDELVRTNPEAYQGYLCRARFLRRRGDDKAAENDLQTAYRLGPDQAEVILEVADVARAKGNWEEASRLLKDGMKRFPANTDFIRAIVGVEILTGKREAAIDHLKAAPRSNELAVLLIDLLIDQKQYAEARTRIDELVKAGLKPTLPNYLKARLCVADQHYSEAIKLLEGVRQDLGAASEWNSRVHVLLGVCYREVGDHERELQAFRRAVEDEASWTAASIGLGQALLTNGRIEEAVQTLEPLRTAKDVPADYWILLSRAKLYRQLRLPAAERRWDEIEEAMAQAGRAAPGSVAVALMRAELLAARGDFAAARAGLEQIRNEHPTEVAVWCVLAELEARQNHFDAAEHILEQASSRLGAGIEIRLAQCRLWGMRGNADALAKLARIEPTLPGLALEPRARLRREVADTWYRLSNWDRAEAGWRAVARELPKDARSRFALLELALQKNQPAQARAWRDELRVLEGEQGWLWRYGDAAILVHEAHGRRAHLDEARKKLVELDQLYKNWPRVAILRATILEMEGKYQSAIQQYTHALDVGDMPPASMARLLELLLLRREFSKAETELAKYEQRTPLGKDLARLGAEAALGLRDKRYARIAVERAEYAVALPVSDYRDGLWLARIYQGGGENAKAEKVLRECLTQAGHAPDVWIAWMEYLRHTNQGDKAPQEFAKLKQAVAKSRQPLTIARCYETLQQPALAGKAYEDALIAAPEDFTTLARAADFYRRADQAALAEQYYRRLLDPALTAPAEYAVVARRQLAALLAPRDAAGRKQALALLDQNQKVLGDTLADQRIRLYLQSLTASARQDAIGKFDDSLRLQRPTPDERLLFARMLEAAGSIGPARDQLAEAVDEAPFAPQYLAPYVRMLIRADDLDDAQRQLARLAAIEPASARTLALRTALERARKAP